MPLFAIRADFQAFALQRIIKPRRKSSFWNILKLASSNAASLGPDTIYVGDESDSTVKSFSAQTGEPGAFVTQNTGHLVGPMGLLIAGPELIVVNQNVDLPLNGEILQYQLKDGSFASAWVPSSDPNAPFAPRGAVLLNGVLYVANLTSVLSSQAGSKAAVVRTRSREISIGGCEPTAKASFSAAFEPSPNRS